MSKTDIAKLFRNGRSQAVRLPREFRFSGERVRIQKVAEGVLLQPMVPDVAEWFAKLDELADAPFPTDRRQPPSPKKKMFR